MARSIAASLTVACDALCVAGMLFGVIVGLAALQSLRRHGLVAYDVAPFAPRHDEGGRESGGFPLSARDGVRLGLGLALVWALHCALHPLLRELVSLVTTADTAAYALAAVVAAFAEVKTESRSFCVCVRISHSSVCSGPSWPSASAPSSRSCSPSCSRPWCARWPRIRTRSSDYYAVLM